MSKLLFFLLSVQMSSIKLANINTCTNTCVKSNTDNAVQYANVIPVSYVSATISTCNNQVYYIVDNIIYKVSDDTKVQIHKSNQIIASIHATEDAIYFTDIESNLYKLDLSSGIVTSIKLNAIAVKYVQSGNKLLCVCADGTITCILLDVFAILWHLQSGLPATTGYSFNTIVDHDILYCFHTLDSLSIVDINSGAVYKNIYMPFRKFAHIHIQHNKLYCVSDRIFAVIDKTTHEAIIRKPANYIHATSTNDTLYAATDRKISYLNAQDNDMRQFYHLGHYTTFFTYPHIYNLNSSNQFLYITTASGTIRLNTTNKSTIFTEDNIIATISTNAKQYTWSHIYSLGFKYLLQRIN